MKWNPLCSSCINFHWIGCLVWVWTVVVSLHSVGIILCRVKGSLDPWGLRSEDLCHGFFAQCLVVTPDGKKLFHSEGIVLGPSKKSNMKCAVTVLIPLGSTEEKSLRTCAARAWVKSACWGFFIFFIFLRHISGCHDVGLRDAFANSNICLDSRAFLRL